MNTSNPLIKYCLALGNSLSFGGHKYPHLKSGVLESYLPHRITVDPSGAGDVKRPFKTLTSQ